MLTHTPLRRRLLVVGSAALLGTLVACGGTADVNDGAPAAAPPTLTTQPASVTVTQGQTATFTTAATGANVTYQWRRAGADVAGANAASYTTAATVLGDSGAAFSVRLCTGPQAGTACVVSNNATLTVNAIALNAALVAGTPGTTGSADGTGAAARFNNANYVAVNSAGTLYVGDFLNHTIRAITPAGVVSTLAGSPGVNGYADGTGAAARFNGSGGLAVDSAGNVFVADWDNFVIRRITPAGVVTTLAGTAGAGGSVDGTGAAARFSNPNGLAIDAAGNLHVADWGNHTIRRITPAGVVTTLAGTPGAPGSANGTGAAARFNQPNGVAVDSAGNVYVSDAANHTIRRITPAGVVTTLAGQPGASGNTDGTGSAARFDTPAWLTISPSGDLFVTSGAGDTVRKITAAGVVTTAVGVAGQNAAVVLGASPRLRNARGVLALSSNQLVIVADNAVLNVTVP